MMVLVTRHYHHSTVHQPNTNTGSLFGFRCVEIYQTELHASSRQVVSDIKAEAVHCLGVITVLPASRTWLI